MAEKKKDQPGDRSAQPTWADEIARRKARILAEKPVAVAPDEARAMLLDFRVRQLELELQNEELRRTQAELQASRARLADLYDHAPVGYITESESGMIVEANCTAARLLGVPRDALDGLALNRHILPEDQDIYYLHRKRLLATAGPQICELRMLRPDHPPFWARLEATVARDTGGEVLCRVVISDVTAEKQAEEERQRLKAQLAQIDKMESIERLAAGVANDFNNMLGIILGHAELALDHADPDLPFLANLREIGKAVDRSAKLTWQLLSFARMQTVVVHGLDLNSALKGMRGLLRRLAGTGVKLSWKVDAGLWSVAMDVSQLEQILANLCSNARDAMAGKGQMTVAAHNVHWSAADSLAHAGPSPGDYVRLVVSDHGCGIGDEARDKLFEPFFTTKELGRGTGLGLAIVYGIVQQNNGFITVHSEPDRGTVFTIYLPRHAGDDGLLPPPAQVAHLVRG